MVVPANAALVMGLSVFPLQTPMLHDLKYSHKNNRLIVYAGMGTCMYVFFLFFFFSTDENI